jgi:uncharacterized protein (TIGR03435 family)
MVKALLLSAFLIAQASAQEFEVASVKPAPPGTEHGGMRGGPGTSSPGQIEYMATTLHAVTARAYGVQRFQIVGPPWFDQERFNLVAKLPARATTQQLQLMLQKLLADRFQLVLHKENRTAVIYEMTVAKSGHKMSVVPAAEPPAPSPNGAAPPAATVGGLTFRSSEDRIELLGQRATMRQLIVWATEQSDRPIIDRTGLTGNYDFAMPWEPQGVRVAEETGVTAPADVAREVPRTAPRAPQRAGRNARD